MPDSVDMPAPVKTTTRLAPAIISANCSRGLVNPAPLARSSSPSSRLTPAIIGRDDQGDSPKSSLTWPPSTRALQASPKGDVRTRESQPANPRPNRLVEARGLLSNLSAQLPRFQWRRGRRSEGDRGPARLYRRAGRRRDLALAGLHLADEGLWLRRLRLSRHRPDFRVPGRFRRPARRRPR